MTATPNVPSAQKLILSSDQLPGTGWRPDDDTDPGSTERQAASQAECSNQPWILRTSEMTDDAGASWYFDQAAQVESITSQAFVYRDEQAAAAALAAYRDLVGRCVSWQMVGTAESGYAYQHDQEVFDAAIGAESVARAETASSIRFPEIPAGTVYWVTSRVGPSVVQVTFRPGSLLGIGDGTSRAVDLASIAVRQAESNFR